MKQNCQIKTIVLNILCFHSKQHYINSLTFSDRWAGYPDYGVWSTVLSQNFATFMYLYVRIFAHSSDILGSSPFSVALTNLLKAQNKQIELLPTQSGRWGRVADACALRRTPCHSAGRRRWWGAQPRPSPGRQSFRSSAAATAPSTIRLVIIYYWKSETSLWARL